MNLSLITPDDLARTYDLLGGATTIEQPVRNNLEAHDLLMVGLPSSALLYLLSQISYLADVGVVDRAVGMSVRTLQRHQKDKAVKILSIEQSNRTWKFAEVLGRASEVLGSKEQAEIWMDTPAIGLNRRKPIDLLSTAVGLEAVEDYLTRMEYGVYA